MQAKNNSEFFVTLQLFFLLCRNNNSQQRNYDKPVQMMLNHFRTIDRCSFLALRLLTSQHMLDETTGGTRHTASSGWNMYKRPLNNNGLPLRSTSGFTELTSYIHKGRM